MAQGPAALAPLHRSLDEAPCFRIAAADTNYFVVLTDPADGVTWITVVEIFERGGKTPPNAHEHAWEQFVVLAGRGLARCGGRETPLARGDILVVPPGIEHVVENTGDGKLYCLTTMLPDESFAALIRAGIPHRIDDEDRRVLAGERA